MIDSGPVHADGRDDHEVTITPRGIPVTEIMAYEAGDLDEDAIVSLFQRLVDNGMAWTLQGHYGRTAMALIEAGLVVWRRT